jgi:hypothetical protein
MPPDFAELLSGADRVYVESAAGCGKTHAISRAVGHNTKGRQLVLTHTHAGIHSLRSRLRSFRVSPRSYHVDTIAGWSLQYAGAYPGLSGLQDWSPTSRQWSAVYQSVLELLKQPVIRRVVQASYAGIYVDEYQDCSLLQHRIVLALADILPCRILGDPLQGIFDFGDPIVDWQRDVTPNFSPLPGLYEPWRWVSANRELGIWLSDVRKRLISGQDIDLGRGPVRWVENSHDNQRHECYRACRQTGTVVAIHKWPQGCYDLASKLKGLYACMEEVECRDLLDHAGKIEQATGTARALEIIALAENCMTKVATELKRARDCLADDDLDRLAGHKKHRPIIDALILVSRESSLCTIADALHAIESIDGAVLYRRELWDETFRALRAYESGQFTSLQDAAWHVRDRARQYGRRLDRRIVSRTLLIKGLEFDHAIVLNADHLDPKHLYVAMTRPSTSLTVLSKEPIVSPHTHRQKEKTRQRSAQ